MGAVGVIIGIGLSLLFIVSLGYYGFGWLHTTLDLNIFVSVILLFVIYAFVIQMMQVIYKKTVKR